MKLFALIGVVASLISAPAFAGIPEIFPKDPGRVAFEEAAAKAALMNDRFQLAEADPVNLTNPGYRRARLPEGAAGMNISKSDGMQRASEWDRNYSNPFKAVTDDFGQLKSILEANGGAEIDSLVVVGPMDKSDFKAIWDCAVFGNLLCLNLEGATMKDNEIPDYALYDPIQFQAAFWLRLKRIMLPEGVVRIGTAALTFMGIREVNIPSTVREIGPNAFSYDYWLNCRLVFPEGLEEIDVQVLHECHGLTIPPILPGTLKRIGSNALSMTRFDSIALPEGLEKIDVGAFQNCYLRKVDFPEGCLDIAPFAFQGSPYLSEVRLPSRLKRIPNSLFSLCQSLDFKSVSINDGCREIGDQAFFWDFLQEVQFNDGLEVIGPEAFNGNSITSVKFPATVKEIGYGVFASMYTDLESVYCAAAVPPLCQKHPDPVYKSTSFGKAEDLAGTTLYVPTGTREAYSRADVWCYFGNIVETSDFPWASVRGVPVDGAPAADGDDIYDLAGRKVLNPQDGEIYIRNGKKFIYKNK